MMGFMVFMLVLIVAAVRTVITATAWKRETLSPIASHEERVRYAAHVAGRCRLSKQPHEWSAHREDWRM
jgi:hypothetical protein